MILGGFSSFKEWAIHRWKTLEVKNRWVTPDKKWDPSPPKGSRIRINRVNRTRAADLQISGFGNDRPIPLVYGRRRIGGKFITRPIVYQNQLVVAVAWGYGEFQEIEQILFDGKEMPSAVTVTNYLGTAIQTADATLVAAFAAENVTFTDTFVLPQNPFVAARGIAYSVLQIPSNIDAFPDISAIVKARKVYDSRVPTTAYTRTPALIFRDWLESDIWGPVINVDEQSVEDLADYNEETVNSVQRNYLDLVLNEFSSYQDLLITFCAYCHCKLEWFPDNNSHVKLIIDKPKSSVFTFTEADIIKGSFQFAKTPRGDRPNKVTVNHTQVIETTDPFRADWVDSPTPAIVEDAGISAGTESEFESVVNMPGITRHDEAYRMALLRYNEAALTDLAVRIGVGAKGAQLEVGDNGTVTHTTLGPTAKPVLVVDKIQSSPGTWALDLYEYDANVWSDDIESEPTYPDTSYPDPNTPPTVTNIVLTEKTTKDLSGKWGSYICIQWDTSVVWPFIKYFHVQVVNHLGLITYEVEADGERTSTPFLPETYIDENNDLQYITYTIKVAAASDFVLGEYSSATIQLDDLHAAPDTVPNFKGIEVGGEVRLWWEKVIDLEVNLRYEIRYGSTSVTWDNASVLDTNISQLHYETKRVVEGTYDFLIKAIDSFNQYSANAAVVNLTVTTDIDAYVQDSYDWALGDSDNIDYDTDRYGTTYYVTDGVTAWDSLFTSNMSTYTSPLIYNNGHSPTQKVTNPTLTGGTGWTGTGGVTLANDRAEFSNSAGWVYRTDVAASTNNAVYFVKFTISSYSAGSVRVWGYQFQNNGPVNVRYSGNGTYIVKCIGDGSSGNFGIDASGGSGNFTGNIDDIYIYEEASWLESGVFDVGALVTGTWQADMNSTQVRDDGEGVVHILAISDYTSDSSDDHYYYPHQNLTVVDEGRYAKLIHYCDIESVIYLERPIDDQAKPYLTYDENTVDLVVSAREESGTATTAAGTVTITLDNSYSKVIQISVIPTASSVALITTVDNIVLGTTSTFDIWVFDSGGTQAGTKTVNWTFKGV